MLSDRKTRTLVLQNVVYMCYLRHNLKRPAVTHRDGLCGISWNFTVLLRGAEKGWAEHCGEIVEGHLVEALIFSNPEGNKEERFSQHVGLKQI